MQGELIGLAIRLEKNRENREKKKKKKEKMKKRKVSWSSTAYDPH
jgi:hypothetical protein